MVIKGPGFANGVIILDEPEAVYYAGQVMSGNVHFELTEAITYSALNLIYLGEALVQRVEKQYEMSGGHGRYKHVKYEGREQYFNYVQCILGGTDTPSTLTAAVHAIPFKFQVPFNAPSSFKGEDGSVNYRITAYLEFSNPPDPKKRQQLVKEFEVVAPLSPETLANVPKPLELVFDEIETCSCFCASKPIKLRIMLPSGALSVGGIVPIEVKVHNDSSTDILEVLCRITKRVTYRTHVPRSEYTTPEQTVAEVKKGPVLSDSRREYRWELPLPPALLPNLHGCGVIDVSYFFKVRVRLTGCNDEVQDEAEVVIGVLPQTTTMTSPEMAALLPKGPVPDPTKPMEVNVPATNYPPSITVEHHSQTANESAQSPYKIGFVTDATVPSVPTQPYPNSGYPYPGGNSGYPYPGNSPYLQRPPPYNTSASQENIAAVPSAPPL